MTEKCVWCIYRDQSDFMYTYIAVDNKSGGVNVFRKIIKLIKDMFKNKIFIPMIYYWNTVPRKNNWGYEQHTDFLLQLFKTRVINIIIPFKAFNIRISLNSPSTQYIHIFILIPLHKHINQTEPYIKSNTKRCSHHHQHPLHVHSFWRWLKQPAVKSARQGLRRVFRKYI